MADLKNSTHVLRLNIVLVGIEDKHNSQQPQPKYQGICLRFTRKNSVSFRLLETVLLTPLSQIIRRICFWVIGFFVSHNPQFAEINLSVH